MGVVAKPVKGKCPRCSLKATFTLTWKPPKFQQWMQQEMCQRHANAMARELKLNEPGTQTRVHPIKYTKA